MENPSKIYRRVIRIWLEVRDQFPLKKRLLPVDVACDIQVQPIFHTFGALLECLDLMMAWHGTRPV